MPKTNAARERKKQAMEGLALTSITCLLTRTPGKPEISCVVHGIAPAVRFTSKGYDGYGCEKCMEADKERREAAKNTVNAQHLVFLRGLSTRELLSMLNSTRRLGGHYQPAYPFGPSYTADEIKTVLADRPHVPNKAEAKELRRQKAHQKRHR